MARASSPCREGEKKGIRCMVDDHREESPLVLYVSPTGRDTWSGALAEPNSAGTDGPLQSIDRARVVVRERKQIGALVAPATVFLLIAHNHIHDLFYSGISCGWVWGYAESVSHDNRIEYNHIHDIGQRLLSDMGGIYTLGVQPGTVLRGNLIYNVEKHNYGGWAI